MRPQHSCTQLCSAASGLGGAVVTWTARCRSKVMIHSAPCCCVHHHAVLEGCRPKTDRNSCRQSDRHDCCGRLPLQVFPQSLPERYVPLHAFALSTSLMKGPLPQQSLEKAQALGLNLSGGASGCYHYLLAAALPASPHNVERHSSGLSLPAVLDGHED